MDNQEQLKTIRKELRLLTIPLLKRAGRWRRGLKIALSILGALLASCGSIAASYVAPENKWLGLTLQGVGAVLIFVGGVVLEFFDENAPDAIRKGHEAIDLAQEATVVIDSLRADFEWFTTLYTTSTVLMDMVEASFNGEQGKGVSDERLRAMLDVLVVNATVLFGTSNDRWNFAIYLLENTNSMLVCRACRRPVRAEEDADHRSWKSGEGHVGLTFQKEREIVCGDSSSPESGQLFDAPPDKSRGDDKNRYRSLASVPIKSNHGKVLGVVVGTSDMPNRFRIREPSDVRALDPVEPLRLLANHLAMLIDVSYILEEPREDKQ